MLILKSTHEKQIEELAQEIRKLHAENKALAFKLAQYKARFKEEN